MMKTMGMVCLMAGLAQGASAQQVCFPQNMCDFRGFACESQVDDLKAARASYRNKASGAQSKAKKLQRSVNHLAAENKRLKAEMKSLGTEETWARERTKVVGDYTMLMLCVREAASLDAAKACLEG